MGFRIFQLFELSRLRADARPTAWRAQIIGKLENPHVFLEYVGIFWNILENLRFSLYLHQTPTQS